MEMSPIPRRAHEAAGVPRMNNLHSSGVGWIEKRSGRVERARDGKAHAAPG
jgi:hypothetical protein